MSVAPASASSHPAAGMACLLLLASFPITPAWTQGTDAARTYERITPKAVQDVVEDAEFAVTERNFRITGQLHVGRGIRERERIEFPDYEVILFCNLGLARRMLERDPAFINQCPARVTVRGAVDGTHIAAPLLPEDPRHDAATAALVREMNAQLRAIVDYATEDWAAPAHD